MNTRDYYMINGDKTPWTSQLKTYVVLFGICFFCYPACYGSPSIRNSMTSVCYRDSLLRHISRNGSADMGCYLSYANGSSVVREDFEGNSFALSTLRDFLHAALDDTLVVVRSIRLDGYCSPDGSAALNDRLARARAQRLSVYLRAHISSYSSYPVEIDSHGADWEGLRCLIQSSSYSWKDEALRVIDSSDSPERKKLQLTRLGNGSAHEILYDMYPSLRRVEVRVTYDMQLTREKLKSYVRPVEVPFTPEDLDEGIAVALPPPEAPPMEPVYPALARQEVPAVNENRPDREKNDIKLKPFLTKEPLFAIKTNLLFDAALAPNVELEVPLGKRWSVMGEYTFPWWLDRDDDWCYQMLQVGLEGRYWLGNREHLKNGRKRNILTGWFVGAYVGGGYYDFQPSRSYGYQGEFYIAAGVSGGYALRLNRSFNMEFSLGVGGLTTHYRKYEVARGSQGNELIRQHDGQLLWIGPTKAKVSLVWLLGNRKGGRR